VIGGGLSGLAAAHRLIELCAAAPRPLDLVLFEAGPRLGGVVATRSIAGYRVELGADSFITNKPWGIDLCRRLGIEDRLIPTDARYRRSLVLRQGKPLSVPDEFQLLAPVSINAVLRSPIFSWPGKLRMALEYVLPRRRSNEDESLAAFVRRRFGREALDRLVQPLVGGIYTSDPEKLSLRATMPRFIEMERTYGSVIRGLVRQKAAGQPADATASGARYGLFATFAEGIAELIDALADKVARNASIHLETQVHSLTPEPDGRGFVLELPYGAKDSFDAVVLAIPAFCASQMLSGFARSAAQALSRIEYASTSIVISGHRLADVRHPLEAFGLVVPAIEQRKILAVSFASRKFPGRAPEGCVQLRTFVGGAMQPELANLPDEKLKSLVRSELEGILGITWRPDFMHVARWTQSMPQYHVGHLDLVASIERELAAFGKLALAGNAYRGVGIPDCIHSGEQAAERVFGEDKRCQGKRRLKPEESSG